MYIMYIMYITFSNTDPLSADLVVSDTLMQYINCISSLKICLFVCQCVLFEDSTQKATYAA